MQEYELTVVLDGSGTAVKKKSAAEKVSKLIKAAGGKPGKLEDWGKKDLAFSVRVRIGNKIKKIDTGIFLHFPLELSTERVKGFSEKLKLEGYIVRYLIVKSYK